MGQKAVFLSTAPSAWISLGTTGERDMDRNNILYPIQKFQDHRLVKDVESEKEIINMLEKHPDNKKNGGLLFFKHTNDMQQVQAVAVGEAVAVAPDGEIDEGIKETLIYLERMTKNYPPNSHNKVVQKALEVYGYFAVKGMPKPDPKLTNSRMRARITDMLGVLEDEGIWMPNDDDDTQGKTDTGQSKDKDR